MSVSDDRRIAASVLAFKAADTATRRAIRQETVTRFRPVWKSAIQDNARRAAPFGPFPDLLRTGVTFGAGNPPQGRAYQRTKLLSGGADPTRIGRQYERGGVKGRRGDRVSEIERTYRTKSRRGTAYYVTRHTARQMAPARPSGYAVWPAVAELGPQAVSLWVSSIVRAYRLAVEDGRKP